MEDVHTYVANFAQRLDWGYFGIFDGHAGRQVASWCGSNMHTILEKAILKNDNVDLRQNLNNAFCESDSLICENVTGSSGCTAAVAVLRWEEEDDTEVSGEKRPKIRRSATPFDFLPKANHKRMLYTANVGDARLVLSRNGKAVRLSYDHKGSDPVESYRISKAGGVVIKGRVNGILAVTRSLGDKYMKNLVIGNPYTTATEITEEDEFLIIACDGLWDVCSDQKAVDLVRKVKNPQTASKILCNYAVDNVTTDNVTVMVVKFDERVFDYKKSSAVSSDVEAKESETKEEPTLETKEGHENAH
ncbi:unnamed protein product [Kuraishia capsulata CBS 1993]|uniref:PPM-type phosphatase domain-containing protein n=1 Tax=Kuraishia capsulata CBS 1993 TaxID=1382522 RepID=W6MTR7_9ASCO|nr:uncharacterized protein KUCA_T00004611001 [Kuraishia capsulata CBS 1993]CDK28627.1 unnamed protein product [Kuraishia capsulata CBS 1993]